MTLLLLLMGTPPWANGAKTPGYAPDNPADYSRHDIVDRWVCLIAASTSFPG